MKRIKILDKVFELSIPSAKIQERIRELAEKISDDLKDEDPVFIGILNGSFIFAADIFRKMSIDSRITFLKLESYVGTKSSGRVKQLIGLNMDIKDMNVVILEDIVDTGTTLKATINHIARYKPATIRVVTLLFKPDACKKNIKMDYIGFNIPNDFVVGYGLDYKGFGRGYEDIYSLVNEG